MKFLFCIVLLVSLVICSIARPQTTFEDRFDNGISNSDEIIRQKRQWGMGYGGMGGMGYGRRRWGMNRMGMGGMGMGGMGMGGMGMGYPMMGMYGRK